MNTSNCESNFHSWHRDLSIFHVCKGRADILKNKNVFKSLLKIVLIKIKLNKNNLYSITNDSNKMSTRENKLNGIFLPDYTPECGKEFTYLKLSYFFNLMRERKYIYVKLKTQMFSESYDNSSV